MVYKIRSREKFENGICQHCGIWYKYIYRITIENLSESLTFDLCYGCHNWLYEEYDIEEG